MRITELENRRLTEVGPGTPGGDLLRHYWQPIAVSSEVPNGSAVAIQVLGERLVLFRDRSGSLGLLGEHCSHRGASLAYGIIEENGLRCAYHGWLYDRSGKCLDRPTNLNCEYGGNADPHLSYPVSELGGLVFCYLGPRPIPALPEFDIFSDINLSKSVRIAVIPCNWLQIMENSLDPLHLEWLHGNYFNYQSKLKAGSAVTNVTKHVELAFELTERGIVKRRLLEGQTKTEEDWTIGQEVVFPNIFCIGSPGRIELQIRVPKDNNNTLHLWYRCELNERCHDNSLLLAEVVQLFNADGSFNVLTIDGQDAMAWVTQGPITDRTKENLGPSDKGVILYRELLAQQIDLVESGECPMGVSFEGNSRLISTVRRKETRLVNMPL